MGCDHRVVGITKFCVHPEVWFRNKKRVGGTKKVNFDCIGQLQPDLIICNKEENTREMVLELKKHYNVLVTDINTLEESYSEILKIGEILEISNTSLIASIKKSFTKIPKLDGSVAYFIWRDPWMVAGSSNFIHDLLQKMGLKNVFGEFPRYPQISLELLQEMNPNYVFLSSEPFPFDQKHMDEIRTYLPETKIVLVDGEYFSWYGSRLLGSVEYFNELFKTLSC